MATTLALTFIGSDGLAWFDAALRYHPSYWAMVFPLGMYGAATYRMRTAVGLEAFEWLPPLVLTVALAAWATAVVGLVREGLMALRRSGRDGSPPVTS